MKSLLILLITCGTMGVAYSQRVNPVIKDYGGIFDIPFAEEKVDPELTYNIIIEVAQGSEKPDALNGALNNVARLINLHAMTGVPKEKMNIVLAIHAGAAFTVMTNEAYHSKYGVNNPNLDLYKKLSEAGVKMFVCGQSLIARDIDRFKMAPEIKIATSMLTTITTYQLKGYAMVTF